MLWIMGSFAGASKEAVWSVALYVVPSIVGLVLFMEGLKVGLMPFAETLGRKLPAKSPLPVVLLITCTLGIGVTFAEPASMITRISLPAFTA